MPNRPIEFTFTSDVEKFLRGLDKAEIGVEDLQAAIKKLPKVTDDAVDKMDDDLDRVGDSAKERGKEAGGNFAQSLGEGLSSGDTSEVLQEVLGEMVGDVSGPASAAIAVGAAIALTAWNAFKKQSEDMKAAVVAQFDLFDEVTGQLDRIAQYQVAITELGGGDFNQGLKDAKKYANDLGLSLEEVTALITGELNPATAATLEYVKQEAAWTGENTEEAYKTKEAAKELLKTTEKNAAALKLATEQQQTWDQASGRTLNNLLGAEDAAVGISGLDLNKNGAVEDAEKINTQMTGAYAATQNMGNTLAAVTKLNFQNISEAARQAGAVQQQAYSAYGSAYATTNRAG